MSHFNSRLTDAASFLIPYMESSDYFQDFDLADLVKDPDGIYAIEADMTDSNDEFTHSEVVREAMEVMATASPADRLEHFKLYASEGYQDEINKIELDA
jgi:hypothetical protein